jgi:hypothetical protein
LPSGHSSRFLKLQQVPKVEPAIKMKEGC